MSLMTAMERSQRPAHAALDRMLRWSLKQDAAELAPAPAPASSCSCGGSGGCH
jgi:hypothetical protein